FALVALPKIPPTAALLPFSLPALLLLKRLPATFALRIGRRRRRLGRGGIGRLGPRFCRGWRRGRFLARRRRRRVGSHFGGGCGRRRTGFGGRRRFLGGLAGGGGRCGLGRAGPRQPRGRTPARRFFGRGGIAGTR